MTPKQAAVAERERQRQIAEGKLVRVKGKFWLTPEDFAEHAKWLEEKRAEAH